MAASGRSGRGYPAGIDGEETGWGPGKAPDDRTAAFRLATGYPYERPAGSYVFGAGGSVGAWSGEAGDLAGRRAMLAVGSNGAPARLLAKFGPDPVDGTIPVLAARLHGLDIVFGARLAPYGSIPATFAASPGTVCHAHVTFLTPAQLEVMDASEGLDESVVPYEVVDLAPETVEVDTAGPVAVSAYRVAGGCFPVAGRPAAFRFFTATGRRFEDRSQLEAIGGFAREMGVSATELVARNAADPGFRRRCLERMAGLAVPYPEN